MSNTSSRKRISKFNGLRAAVFFASMALATAFMVGGLLLGNAVAFSVPYFVAALVLAGYIVRDVFGIGVSDALFSEDEIIEFLRKRHRGRA